jgi:hypothetical protein
MVGDASALMAEGTEKTEPDDSNAIQEKSNFKEQTMTRRTNRTAN